LDPAGRGLA